MCFAIIFAINKFTAIWKRKVKTIKMDLFVVEAGLALSFNTFAIFFATALV